MASCISVPSCHSVVTKTRWETPNHSLPRTSFVSLFISNPSLSPSRVSIVTNHAVINTMVLTTKASAGAAEASTAEKPRKRNEAKGFVEEMRLVSVKLHTKDQAKGGEKDPPPTPMKWEPTVGGYLRFLVDSKLVYDTLEAIIDQPAFPFYSEFRNTGLERSESLARDLEWFKQEGNNIPEPSSSGISYSVYLKKLSEKDPQAFICHYYNFYFAHTAGGRMIGKKVSEMILDKKELEFYKWDGNLSGMLQNVKDKLNKVAEEWTREEKNHCLEETEKSFKYSGDILRLIMS